MASQLTTTIEGREHLVGSRCTSCGTHTFPVQAGCPRCGGDTESAALPSTGALWSWTVQRVRPKPPYRGPDEFAPFAVGYVDLGPVLVESRLEGRPVDAWRIGEPVQLTVGRPDAGGTPRSYAFEPAASEGTANGATS
jgi:uncharacterized OB-fold protein